MNEIPDFAEALVRFRNFLGQQGHSDDTFWIFREDVWQLSVNEIFVKFPAHAKNESLARKVFAEGRERGLVEIKAVAVVGDKVAATVWFPKFPKEEVQGWNRGMKLAISDPLPRAKTVGPLRWWFLRFLPRFRHYQRAAIFIGTRGWAAA